MIGPCARDCEAPIDDRVALTVAGTSCEFRNQAQQMPELTRRLLLHGEDGTSVAAADLLEELQLPAEILEDAQRGLASSQAVLRKPAVLSGSACAVLRSAVDAESQSKVDSVDGAPDHQLNLSRARLERLIGIDAVSELWRLAAEYMIVDSSSSSDAMEDCAPASAAAAAAATAPASAPLAELESRIFIRRYAPSTRPWNPFHTDSSAVTINVALNADTDFAGARGSIGGWPARRDGPELAPHYLKIIRMDTVRMDTPITLYPGHLLVNRPHLLPHPPSNPPRLTLQGGWHPLPPTALYSQFYTIVIPSLRHTSSILAGGRLLCCHNGSVRVVERIEGEG